MLKKDTQIDNEWNTAPKATTNFNQEQNINGGLQDHQENNLLNQLPSQSHFPDISNSISGVPRKRRLNTYSNNEHHSQINDCPSDEQQHKRARHEDIFENSITYPKDIGESSKNTNDCNFSDGHSRDFSFHITHGQETERITEHDDVTCKDNLAALDNTAIDGPTSEKIDQELTETSSHAVNYHSEEYFEMNRLLSKLHEERCRRHGYFFI